MRGAAGYGLGTTTKYQRGFAGYGPGTTTKSYRCSASSAASNGMCITAKYQRDFAGWRARASRMTSEPFHQGGNLFVRARRSV